MIKNVNLQDKKNRRVKVEQYQVLFPVPHEAYSYQVTSIAGSKRFIKVYKGKRPINTMQFAIKVETDSQVFNGYYNLSDKKIYESKAQKVNIIAMHHGLVSTEYSISFDIQIKIQNPNKELKIKQKSIQGMSLYDSKFMVIKKEQETIELIKKRVQKEKLVPYNAKSYSNIKRKRKDRDKKKDRKEDYIDKQLSKVKKKRTVNSQKSMKKENQNKRRSVSDKCKKVKQVQKEEEKEGKREYSPSPKGNQELPEFEEIQLQKKKERIAKLESQEQMKDHLETLDSFVDNLSLPAEIKLDKSKSHYSGLKSFTQKEKNQLQLSQQNLGQIQCYDNDSSASDVDTSKLMDEFQSKQIQEFKEKVRGIQFFKQNIKEQDEFDNEEDEKDKQDEYDINYLVQTKRQIDEEKEEEADEEKEEEADEEVREEGDEEVGEDGDEFSDEDLEQKRLSRKVSKNDDQLKSQIP